MSNVVNTNITVINMVVSYHKIGYMSNRDELSKEMDSLSQVD